jgi:bis(5'-nucleosyl)-tetraphosphatase (symmetrical)
LISICYGHQKESHGDTLTAVLKAVDKIEIIEWLRHRPLIIKNEDYTVTHAGVPPIWSTDNALSYSSEVCSLLQSDNEINNYLSNLYGQTTMPWSNNLTGPLRWQFITNYLTRMRYCTQQGELGFTEQQITHKDFKPWFAHKKNKLDYNEKIIFGHWSKLNGKTNSSNIISIDTGCVWGGALTAYSPNKNTKYSTRSTINRRIV